MAKESGKFRALASFRQEPENGAPATAPQPQGRAAVGKKSNPDYEPTTILMRKKLKRAARRKLEDMEAAQDLSEKIEELLTKWVSEPA